MTINIEKETRIKLDVDYEKIADLVCNEVLRSEELDDNYEVSILLTNDKNIQQINKENRRIDRATDVLSFPAIDFDEPSVMPEDFYLDVNPETGDIYLGDIVVSLDKVRSQAAEYGHSLTREFAFLICHSMLHLLGYDHILTKEEEKIMFEKQEAVLTTLGITREKKKDIKAIRDSFKDKKRVVVKIGSSSLTHKQTGELDLVKVEKLVRELTDIRNQGKDVILVSSGAIMVGRNTLGERSHKDELNFKQACASVGQAKLMMIYQKLFAEYNQLCSQILLTSDNIVDDKSRVNAKNTMDELLSLGVIPVVNENDTVAVSEIANLSVLGDNDTLSAIVASLMEADLLILLSDIDGLYTDDPNKNENAQFIDLIEDIDDNMKKMAKGPSSNVGTGGMSTKLSAGIIATNGGADMVIASGDDFSNIHEIMLGSAVGSVFAAKEKNKDFLVEYITKND